MRHNYADWALCHILVVGKATHDDGYLATCPVGCLMKFTATKQLYLREVIFAFFFNLGVSMSIILNTVRF
jgi:hypothetical protein